MSGQYKQVLCFCIHRFSTWACLGPFVLLAWAEPPRLLLKASKVSIWLLPSYWIEVGVRICSEWPKQDLWPGLGLSYWSPNNCCDHVEMHPHLHLALHGVWDTDGWWHCCLHGGLWGPLLGNLWQRLNGLVPFTLWVYTWTVIQLKNVKFTYCIFFFNIIIILIYFCFCLAFPAPSSSSVFLCGWDGTKTPPGMPFLVFSLAHHESRPSTGPAKEKNPLLSSDKVFLRLWKYLWITHHEKFQSILSNC